MFTKHAILGLGKLSTEFYISEIHRLYHLKKGGYSTFPMLILQTDFQKINPFLPSDFDTLLPTIHSYFDQLSSFGISKLLIPNITLHATVDQLNYNFSISHPIELLKTELQKRNGSSVYLFGTRHTARSGYFLDNLRYLGINIIPLPLEIEDFLDEYRTKVYHSNQNEDDITYFQKLIKNYSENHPVILACTELSIFAPKLPNCLDLVQLQIADFINF